MITTAPGQVAVAPAVRYRINSIDILRGLVMVIMALDHVRDGLMRLSSGAAEAAITDPTNMQSTTPPLFFTRWITHFCAPSFVFLAGTSAFLMTQKKSKSEVSRFLMIRGIWLIVVEIVLITLGITFNPLYNVIIFQVIWAIGISMFLLGLLVHLPKNLIMIMGLAIVFFHNLLILPQVSSVLKGGFWSDLLYYSKFSLYEFAPQHSVIIVYAFVPWLGIMMVGFGFGRLYQKHIDPRWRRKVLVGLGIGLMILFLLLRVINVYGDPAPWAHQPRGSVFTLLSFLNVTKYPPSLQFVSMTLAPAMLLLALFEKVENKFTRVMNVFGRVPMFYYILHFYLIHIIGVILFYSQGYKAKDIVTPGSPFLFKPPDFGISLFWLYMVWLIVVVIMYFLCKHYNNYKNTHQKWWLPYL